MNKTINPTSPIRTEIIFNLVIFSSLKSNRTQNTVNNGIVEMNILCKPEDIFFNA